MSASRLGLKPKTENTRPDERRQNRHTRHERRPPNEHRPHSPAQSGKLEIRYRVADKTRTETVRGGKRDAQRRLRELLTLADQGRHPEDPNRLTVTQWLDRWLSIIKAEAAAQTWINYDSRCGSISSRAGNLLLARLSPGDLQAFYSALGASGLKASSARRVCSILNTAINRAVELRLIAGNPGDAVRKRMPKREAATDAKVLDHEQCAALLIAARATDLYPAVLIALATGMRRNRFLALRWNHVDFAAGEIRVEQSIVHVRGETTARRRRMARRAPSRCRPKR